MTVHRFPYYHQVEQSDCGVTCLRMVARYFGRRVPVKYLRDRVDLSRSGVSVRSLKGCAEAIGMKGYGVKLSLEAMADAPLPVILHWNRNHFAVLWKIDRKGWFHVADPSGGMLRYSKEEFKEHFCGDGDRGIALMLAPTERFYSMELPHEATRQRILSSLRENVVSHRRSYLAILTLALVALVADMCVPLLMRRTIDEGIARADISLVWLLVLAQIAVFTGSQLTSSTSGYIVNRLGLRLSMKAVDRYLSKLVSLPLRFFDSRVNADLIQKTYDRERMQQFILDTPTTILLTAINIILFSGLLIWFSPLIFGGFVALTLAGLLWETGMLRRRRNIDYDINIARARNNNNVYELVNGIAELKAHNAHNRRVGIWRGIQTRLNRLQQRSDTLRLTQSGVSALLYQSRDLAVTGLCATLVIAGGMTIGTMVTVAFVAGRLSSGFNSISGSLSSLQQAAISLDRCNDVMDEPSEERTGKIGRLDGDIVLHSVTFKYPGAENSPVIDNLDLTIARGQTTAIVGPSGCGKSTLMKLLQNLYQPVEGYISAGQTDIATLPPEEWGKICTGVSQSGYIFSDSIAGNIALGEETPDMERVARAAATACLAPLLAKLPLGLHTLVGPTGLELSGGERQRLLIARAIYRDTPMLLLDEATSSLDAPTERQIVENLKHYGEGRTMVIAAHRLSTISHADLIIFMDGGKVIEAGTHASLLSLSGRYSAFVKGQTV